MVHSFSGNHTSSLMHLVRVCRKEPDHKFWKCSHFLYNLFIGFIAICPSEDDEWTSWEYHNYCEHEEELQLWSSEELFVYLDIYVFLRLNHAAHPDIRKVFEQWLFQHSCSKIWSTLFSPVGDWFPWKWKWNKHSSFQILSCPMPTENCKCHLVNSEDPEFFRFKVAEGEERKMFARSFHFSVFEKKVLLYDCLSYQQTIIGHTQSPTVSLLIIQSKSFFHPPQSFYLSVI